MPRLVSSCVRFLNQLLAWETPSLKFSTSDVGHTTQGGERRQVSGPIMAMWVSGLRGVIARPVAAGMIRRGMALPSYVPEVPPDNLGKWVYGGQSRKGNWKCSLCGFCLRPRSFSLYLCLCLFYSLLSCFFSFFVSVSVSSIPFSMFLFSLFLPFLVSPVLSFSLPFFVPPISLPISSFRLLLNIPAFSSSLALFWLLLLIQPCCSQVHASA